MGRHRRLLYDGAIYHIISRGHNRYKVFNVIWDYETYKSLLKEHKDKIRFELFHYCLMPNHIHLLLRIEKGESAWHRFLLPPLLFKKWEFPLDKIPTIVYTLFGGERHG